jgi:hypothetical protein
MRPLRISLLCGGALLVALALAAARLGLSNPGAISIARFVIGAAGLGLVLLSALLGSVRLTPLAATLGPLAGAYRNLSVILLTTLLLLCAADGVSYLINQRYLYAVDPRARLPYYQTQAWAGKYWREHVRAFGQTQYVPYIEWRTAPFQGETIQIDANGVRRTPGGDASGNSFKVFAFGGSAMLGFGSPDWETIPAYLQQDMKGRHPAVSVTNFGEKGWVSTQDVLMLMRQLQAGNIPDMVVFYDGLNDALFALENGRADGHAGQKRISVLLEHPLAGALLDSNLSKFILPRLAHFRPRAPQAAPDDSLASAVADTYLANTRIVEALAFQYGFKFEFFLQPIISIDPKDLTAEEQKMSAEMDYTAPEFRALVSRVYALIAARSPASGKIRPLTKVFAGQKSQLWIDWVHVTPEGNKMVADAMAGSLQ